LASSRRVEVSPQAQLYPLTPVQETAAPQEQPSITVYMRTWEGAQPAASACIASEPSNSFACLRVQPLPSSTALSGHSSVHSFLFHPRDTPAPTPGWVHCCVYECLLLQQMRHWWVRATSASLPRQLAHVRIQSLVLHSRIFVCCLNVLGGQSALRLIFAA
jgi:hypothetical protein